MLDPTRLPHLLISAWLPYVLNFDWLGGVSPGMAKAVFLGLFILSGLLVLAIPRASIVEGVEAPRWWHNLKLWALGVLAVIFTIYSIF